MSVEQVGYGDPAVLGATPVSGGTYFAVPVGLGKVDGDIRVEVCKLSDTARNAIETPFELKDRKEVKDRDGKLAGYIYEGVIPEIKEGDLYGFRVDGPWDPMHGFRYNHNKLLVDPMSKALEGKVDYTGGVVYGYQWAPKGEWGNIPDRDLHMDTRDSKGYVPVARVVDWKKLIKDYGGARPRHKLTVGPVIEGHPKGSTKLLLPEEQAPGTYKALSSDRFIRSFDSHKTRHFQVMPTDKHAVEHFLEEQGKTNYWKYNSISFCAPDEEYAADRHHAEIEYFSSLKKLRKRVDIMKDVAFGHTPEGNRFGPTFSFKGLGDYYYVHGNENRDKRYYADYTGCGNTINAKNPLACMVVKQALEYAANFFPGFRFDHAHSLGREDGNFTSKSAVYEAIRTSPILRDHIPENVGEPWDNEYGEKGRSLGADVPYAQYNDKFRETAKAAVFGGGADPRALANCLMGSDWYISSPARGVNYFTSHDNKTLYDMTLEYLHLNEKDMEVEKNRDRVQQRMQFAMAILAASLGIPMLPLGHASGHSNAHIDDTYNIDSETTWPQWKGLPDWRKRAFDSSMHAFDVRHRHAAELAREDFIPKDGTYPETGKRMAIWYNTDGKEMTQPEWDNPDGWKDKGCFSYVLAGRPEKLHKKKWKDKVRTRVGPDVYIAVNESDRDASFILPELPKGTAVNAPDEPWRLAHDSSMLDKKNETAYGVETHLPGTPLRVPARSLVICEGGKERYLTESRWNPKEPGGRAA